MCGIAGILSANGDVPAAEMLASMSAILRHRGPDDEGIHAEAGFGLVHRRLSILDLSDAGHQPMWDPSGRWAIAYNGEVYNFRELRAELEGQGEVFRSGSDTEVVLRALVRLGPREALRRFNGMFALALWDREGRKLLVARDRLGIKPMFLKRVAGAWLFASEIKAFTPQAAPELDAATFMAMLSGASVTASRYTLFKDVRQLRPGEFAIIDDAGRATFDFFFPVTDYLDAELARELAGLPEERLIDRVDAALRTSIERELVSDAPLATMASGGLDSSIICALVARLRPDMFLYHSNVVGPLSELQSAQSVAAHLKLELRHVDVDHEAYLQAIADAAWHNEIPSLIQTNDVPMMLLTSYASEQGIKVFLTGEGADEVFFGYPEVVLDRIRRRARALMTAPQDLLRRAGKLGRFLAPPLGAASIPDRLARRFENEQARPTLQAGVERNFSRSEQPWGLQSLEMLRGHLSTLLWRNDRMGMKASIEARFPFLDDDLMRLAVNLPVRAKLHYGINLSEWKHPFVTGKWALRKVTGRHMPPEVMRRKKLGFRTDFYDRVRISAATLQGGLIEHFFTLDAASLQHLVDSTPAAALSRLARIDLWGRLFFLGDSRDDITRRLRETTTQVGGRA